jgi:hypothetical protein
MKLLSEHNCSTLSLADLYHEFIQLIIGFSLVLYMAVPIAVYVFTLPLPYLGVASSLPAGFVAGAIVLVLGLLIYAWTPSR